MRQEKGWRPVANPEPLPVATLGDVKMTLEGLAPGIYLARDLYARYQAAKSERGETPVASQVFGRMLTQFGLIKRQRQGSRAWLVQ